MYLMAEVVDTWAVDTGEAGTAAVDRAGDTVAGEDIPGTGAGKALRAGFPGF